MSKLILEVHECNKIQTLSTMKGTLKILVQIQIYVTITTNVIII